jgi:hypothetical protein
MARKPKDFDAQLQALMERTKKLKGQKTIQLGELVQATDADTLPVEALAGVLLAAVEQAKKQPEAVARWTERGHTFFQQGSRRERKSANGAAASGDTGEPAPGPTGHGATAPTSDGRAA